MKQGYPLAQLAVVVALARGSAAPTRLLLRNSERFGLVHLYFAGGHLVDVEGHRDSPFNTLNDLATWWQGLIRRDDAEPALAAPLDLRLDAVLDQVLTALASRGVLSPSVLLPSAPHPSSSFPFAPDRGIGVLAAPHARAPMARTSPEVIAASDERLTMPQWQLIAFAVRQIIAQANAVLGGQNADRIFGQALAHAARRRPLLAALALDPSGWLIPTQSDAMVRFSAFDIADAIAAVLAGFETRCASFVGPERARDLIVSAVEPFRVGLAQIGLDVSE
jgi:hypothetical protein